MVIIDPRIGSGDLFSPLRQLGVNVERQPLDFGDACFEGKGPRGDMLIGVERKKLHDMLDCIESHRYTAHQLPGMLKMYERSFLIVEGEWCCHDSQDMLMEKYGSGWGKSRARGSRTILYSKLYRYLISVALAGVTITYSRDIKHTARNITDIYHYFQKAWGSHTALKETQIIPMMTLSGKASLTREWAARLPGVGVKHSHDAERRFKTPLALAEADEKDWMEIPGIGPKTAINIVKKVRGRK